MKTLLLSVIIPCYNEYGNLPTLINRIEDTFPKNDCEVILVDNGSTDQTSELLNKLLVNSRIITFIRVDDNQGYGSGILQGLHVAKGRILSWTHADNQTDPFDCIVGLEKFKAYGTDIFVKGQRKGRPWSDIIFTTGMSIFESILLGKLMRDINAQPTMISKESFENWKNPPNDFSLDLYAYYQALKNKIRIYRFPVSFKKRLDGVSHWNFSLFSKLKFISRTIKYSYNLSNRKDL